MAAPETGVRRIHAGIKATEAKALRGARLHPLWMLDVTGDSELVRHESAVREHNRRAAAAVLTNPVTAAAVGDHEEWTAYA
jgi:hypothetical protein